MLWLNYAKETKTELRYESKRNQYAKCMKNKSKQMNFNYIQVLEIKSLIQGMKASHK